MNSQRHARWIFWLIITVFWVWPFTADAHSLGRRIGDFYWGFLHPVTALESVFPLVAFGLLAGQQGVVRARAMLLAFSAALLAGIGLGMNLSPAGLVSWINLSSFVVLGLMLAAAREWNANLLMFLTVVFGACQGWGQAGEIGDATGAWLFVSGLTAGAYLSVAFLAASAVALVRQGGWREISIRVLGSWIAAIGLMVMALR